MRRRRLFGRRSGGGVAVLILIILTVALVGDGDEEERSTRPGTEPRGRAPGEERDQRGSRHRAPPARPRQPSARGPAIRGTPAVITRVVDGDTVVASIGGEEEYVRYIGVDTPESVKPGSPVECYGERASRFNQRLVEGRRVRLVFDRERRDVYDRLLAYVYVGPRFVNAILVRRGLARTLTISPNDSRAGLFERLEVAAGRAGRGLWRAC